MINKQLVTKNKKISADKTNVESSFDNPTIDGFSNSIFLKMHDIVTVEQLVFHITNLINDKNTIYSINRLLNAFWFSIGNQYKNKDIDEQIILLYIKIVKFYWFKNIDVNDDELKKIINSTIIKLADAINNENKVNFRPNKFIKKNINIYLKN